jgi:hypothetical protein
MNTFPWFKLTLQVIVLVLVLGVSIARAYNPDCSVVDPDVRPFCEQKNVDIAVQNLKMFLKAKPSPADLEAFTGVVHKMDDLTFFQTWATLKCISDEKDGGFTHKRTMNFFDRTYPGESDVRTDRLFNKKIAGRMTAMLGGWEYLPGFGLNENEIAPKRK